MGLLSCTENPFWSHRFHWNSKKQISSSSSLKTKNILRWAVVANIYVEIREITTLGILALSKAAAHRVAFCPHHLRVVSNVGEVVCGRAVGEIGHLRMPGLDALRPCGTRNFWWRRHINVLATAFEGRIMLKHAFVGPSLSRHCCSFGPLLCNQKTKICVQKKYVSPPLS
jgi:hypothetical protein